MMHNAIIIIIIIFQKLVYIGNGKWELCSYTTPSYTHVKITYSSNKKVNVNSIKIIINFMLSIEIIIKKSKRILNSKVLIKLLVIKPFIIIFLKRF